MAYNEGNRYLYLDTPLGASKLLLQSFTGSEGLSQLFDFQLELLADNATTVDFDQLIGQKVNFGVVGAESALIAAGFQRHRGGVHAGRRATANSPPTGCASCPISGRLPRNFRAGFSNTSPSPIS